VGLKLDGARMKEWLVSGTAFAGGHQWTGLAKRKIGYFFPTVVHGFSGSFGTADGFSEAYTLLESGELSLGRSWRLVKHCWGSGQKLVRGSLVIFGSTHL